MYYDEIDQYVDRFYREKEEASNREILYGEVIDEDWRTEEIENLVQRLGSKDRSWENFWHHQGKQQHPSPQVYSAPAWDGTEHSRSRLESPLDDKIQDNLHPADVSWKRYDSQIQYFDAVQQRAITCAEWAILGGIGLLMVLLLFVIT
jgi:S-formylglutathione hydrolase FrmB